MLFQELKTQASEFFVAMKHPVELVFFTDLVEASDSCEETLELLNDLTPLSVLLSLQVLDFQKHAELAARLRVDKAKTIVVTRMENGQIVDFGIRIVGHPGGYELSALVNAILLVSTGKADLAPETVDYLHNLKKQMVLQVFSTPT